MKPRPYFSMAGQAPITSEARMPSSKASVSSAAACAVQPNRRSRITPARALRTGGLLMLPRRGAGTVKGERASSAGSVEDTCALVVVVRAGRERRSRPVCLPCGLPGCDVLAGRVLDVGPPQLLDLLLDA